MQTSTITIDQILATDWFSVIDLEHGDNDARAYEAFEAAADTAGWDVTPHEDGAIIYLLLQQRQRYRAPNSVPEYKLAKWSPACGNGETLITELTDIHGAPSWADLGSHDAMTAFVDELNFPTLESISSSHAFDRSWAYEWVYGETTEDEAIDTATRYALNSDGGDPHPDYVDLEVGVEVLTAWDVDSGEPCDIAVAYLR